MAEMAELPEIFARATVIINQMLERLREGQEVLQRRAVQKLQHTNAKLSEISSATESAATDIMDGLDRALLVIDELDGEDVGPRGAEIGGRLRDELFDVMTHLQFQDITSQQLGYAASLIEDMERSMSEFASLFDLQTAVRSPEGELPEEPRTFDPFATTHGAQQRQALVDELLTVATD